MGWGAGLECVICFLYRTDSTSLAGARGAVGLHSGQGASAYPGKSVWQGGWGQERSEACCRVFRLEVNQHWVGR